MRLRTIIGIIVTLIVGYVVYLVWHYFATTSVLAVTTNNTKAVIELSQLGEKTRKIGTGSVSVRLKAGDYGLAATDGAAVTTKSVHMTSGQNIEVALTIKPLATVASLAEYTAASIVANTTGLTFLNTPFSVLYRLDAGTSVAHVYKGDIYPITSAFWIDGTHAYITNSDGQLSYFDGNTAAKLLPGTANDDTIPPAAESVTINHQGQLAYISDNVVYFVGAPGQQPATRSKLDTGSWSISLADDGTLLVSDQTIKPDASTSGKHQSSYLLQTASAVRTVLNSDLDYLTPGASWSPDSTQFFYATSNGMYLYKISTKKSIKLFTGSPTHPATATWTDATHVIYAQDHSIWSYDSTSQASTKVTDIAGSLNPLNRFTLSPDKNKVYYGTDPTQSGDGGFIYSFGL